MRHFLPALGAALVLSLGAQAAWGQQASAAKPPRDPFFWLGEINKATAVINTEQGLLDKSMAPRLAAGVAKVINDGNQPGAKRPASVITFEPLLIKAAGEDVTLLHAGRSSQDMHATYRSAILRDKLLDLADQLNATSTTLVELAAKHSATIVPNYTNGVAAQPNGYGHYLLGQAAGLARDAQRIREAYARIDRSPMGTTVLNGTSWPLDRKRMAQYLGFTALVDNAYDASQISSMDQPVEVASIVTSIALRTGNFVEDVMTQYAQSRPWILLEEGGGNTYASSAMPQAQSRLAQRHAQRRVDRGDAGDGAGDPDAQHHARHERPQGRQAELGDGRCRHRGAQALGPRAQGHGDQPRPRAGGTEQRLDRLAGTGRRADAQVQAAVP